MALPTLIQQEASGSQTTRPRFSRPITVHHQSPPSTSLAQSQAELAAATVPGAALNGVMHHILVTHHGISHGPGSTCRHGPGSTCRRVANSRLHHCPQL